MRPVTVRTTVDAPREHVFNYLSDIANHAEFTDHFLKDFRLERLDSRGVGAAARFRISSPLSAPLGLDVWAEAVFAELKPPYRIVVEGSGGRIGRTPIRAVYQLTKRDSDMTDVELTFSSEPASPADRFRELLAGRVWLTLQWRRALRRMKWILEQGEPSARAVRVAPG
jgi:carbon monoxide dehydrogenase subunit G